MELTPERRKCLEVVEAAGGCMSDEAPELAPFCDDNSTLTTPDIINQCFDAGWLRWSHNSLFDTATVRLTDEGKAALGR